MLAVREYESILDWMHRAARADARPLPLLLVAGSTGAGKSAAVRQAAAAARVELTFVESEDGPLLRKSSWREYEAMVRARLLVPTVLVFDDADALLHGEAKSNVDADDFVTLGKQQLPVCVIATDTYTSTTLRDLAKRRKDVEHVTMPLPRADRVEARMCAEFPTLSATTVHASVAECAGDMRRTRLMLANAPAAVAPDGGCVVPTSDKWSVLKALLGVAKYSMPLAADRRMAVLDAHDLDFLERQVHAHYLETAPSIEAAAEAADAFAFADTKSDGLHRYVTLEAIPSRLQRAQREANALHVEAPSFASTYEPTRDADIAVELQYFRWAAADVDDAPHDVSIRDMLRPGARRTLGHHLDTLSAVSTLYGGQQATAELPPSLPAPVARIKALKAAVANHYPPNRRRPWDAVKPAALDTTLAPQAPTSSSSKRRTTSMRQ